MLSKIRNNKVQGCEGILFDPYASFWGMKREDKIGESSSALIIGNYIPVRFGFNTGLKGLKPVDFEIK